MFGPRTLTWRVNREPSIFIGGGRALLMQVAHPAVAAGVRDHSDYETHPWLRLYRTLDTTLKMAFGRPATSARAAGRLAGAHRTVEGLTEDGSPYSAADPELLLWVWATLVDTAASVYERCIREISDRAMECLYAEQLVFARACGIPTDLCPSTWRAFASYVEQVIEEDLHVTDAARAVAASVLTPTHRFLEPVFKLHAIVTADLLPATLRAAYDLGPDMHRPSTAHTIYKVIKSTSRAVPGPLRRLPVSVVVAIPDLANRPEVRQVPA